MGRPMALELPVESRAWQISIKGIDEERRQFSGTATTPNPDRVGDVIEPLGISFENPVPLLLNHNFDLPVGEAILHPATVKGIDFTATIASISDPGVLKDRLDMAWQSVKARLIKGVSVRVTGRGEHVRQLKGGGLHWLKSEVPELSLVTIPMNRDARIASVKYYALDQAASGEVPEPNTPGVAGLPVVRILPPRREPAMKPIAEQITSYKSTRDQKFQDMQALITKSSDEGRTLDPAESEQYETLKSEIDATDVHLKRLESFQESQKALAVPVVGNDPVVAHVSRGGGVPVIRMQPNEDPGIGFAKAILCKVASYLSQGAASPLDIARARYPDNDRVLTHLKATIPAGTTTGTTWAAPFIDPTNLTSEFIEFQRPGSILGKLNLRRVPFNVRILGQTSGGDAYWVAEGAPKPVTKFDFNAVTLPFHKVATITVITKELARFSTPSAERIVRDSLAKAVTARIDQDLIDPGQAAVSGVNPASLTNGLTAMTPSGTTADAARSDLARIVKSYLDNNNNVATLALVMPASLALSLSVMRNALGQREFDGVSLGGGMLEGITVVTSQYAANQSGAGNLVVAINQEDVLLADDGNVTVDASTQASIQMLDNPTNSSATGTPTSVVSLWQTNSIGLLAEREITWMKARSTSVVYMDDVNWGSIGSPA